MAASKLCPVCKGYKNVTIDAGLKKPCENCDGIGYVFDEIEKELDNDLSESPIKKRGRPKKGS